MRLTWAPRRRPAVDDNGERVLRALAEALAIREAPDASPVGPDQTEAVLARLEALPEGAWDVYVGPAARSAGDGARRRHAARAGVAMSAPLDFHAACELADEIRACPGWTVTEVLGPRAAGPTRTRLRRAGDPRLRADARTAPRIAATVRCVDPSGRRVNVGSRARWERLRTLASVPLGSRWLYAGSVYVLVAVRPVDYAYTRGELFMVLVAREGHPAHPFDWWPLNSFRRSFVRQPVVSTTTESEMPNAS